MARPEAFFELGVTHILTGYDHLLFLLGLLLVCRTARELLALVTCFTVAHSLTLAAAALGWTYLPPRLIEPAIAFSIIFVGVENIWSKGNPRFRKSITFFFGLIHGFGFAYVLREVAAVKPGNGFLVPLLSFNLGVEVGQVAIAALVLPLIWWLRRAGWLGERGVRIGSGFVALIGCYWLVERWWA